MTGKELIDYLSAQQFKMFPDSNFIPDLEESHLPALFVFSSGGSESDSDLPIQYPTFQVIVKGKSYKSDIGQMDLTEQLAKKLIKLLDKKIHYEIGSNYVYESRSMQSNPIPIGLDTYDRPTYSTNFRFKIQPILPSEGS
jgi:Bacteriophage minor capsid protein